MKYLCVWAKNARVVGSYLHVDEQPVVYSSSDELVTNHNWSAHECKVKVMSEMLHAWIENARALLGKRPPLR